MHGNSWNPLKLRRIFSTALLLAGGQLGLLAADTTNWVAFNDHVRASVAANVSSYSISTGAGAGGPLTNYLSGSLVTPNQVGIDITPCCGTINGVTGSSAAPRAGTPADQIFGTKIDWNGSALYFGASPYTAKVTYTFTNLDSSKRYVFRGSAVRGNNYPKRWTLATIDNVLAADPAHITGTGSPASPGIVTNGWVPFGTNLVAGRQAGWNSGENRCGDVIGWDNIVPNGTSFSIILSNHAAATLYVPNTTGGTETIDNYGYAFDGIMLAEVGEPLPVGITVEPPAETAVEEYASLALSLTVTGTYPRYTWYKGELGSGDPVGTSATYTKNPVLLADAGNYYVVATNEINTVTSTLAHVTVSVNALSFTQQPPALVPVVELRPFTLSVGVTGTHPVYQWYVKTNGDWYVLDGATGSSYSVAVSSLSDSGQYRCVVTNSLYAITSSVAQVTVSNDEVAPTVVRVVGNPGFDTVTIEFSEPVDEASAQDGFNYSIDPAISWSDGVLTNGGKSLIMPAYPQDPNTTYTIYISGVSDLVGNTIDESTTVTFTSLVTNKVGMLFEKFSNVTGTWITNLTQAPNYPNNPDAAYALTEFNPTNAFTMIPDDAFRNYYGGRVRGWFIPPFSAQWRFFISADDGGELWFNPTGPTAAGAIEAAKINGDDCCDPFQEPPNMRTSEPFALIAGQPYYIEGLFKEHAGGDYLVVAARPEGDTTPAGSLYWITNAIAFPGIPPGLAGTLTIDTQPVNVTVEDPNPATFSVAASSSTGAPILYQWQRNDGSGTFTNLPGANVKTYRLAVTEVTIDNGAEFRCVVSSADVEQTSTSATLTVTPDATGPLLVSAIPDATFQNVTVTFSEELDATAAGTAGNYSICQAFNAANCISVTGAVVQAGNKIVVLQAELPVTGSIYRLAVGAGVIDVAGNPVQQPRSAVLADMLTFQQGSNGYTGTLDTHIRSDNPTTTYGTAVAVLADNLSPLSHALLRFDNIFGAGVRQVPLNATITSATLKLRTDNAGNDTRVHRMKVTWDNNSTWNNVGSANDGVNPATGDEESTSEFTFASGAVGDIQTLNVLASINFWHTNGGPNYGWSMHDTGDDGYQFNSSEATAIEQRPLLTIVYIPSADTNPVSIVTAPADKNINEGQSFTLSVVVDGTLPAFQWYKGTDVIPGATASTYTVTGANETHSGVYKVVVTNFYPSSVEASANVVVNPDTNGPVLLTAVGSTPTNIVLTFDQAITQAAADNIANYSALPASGGAALTIESATLATNGTTVTLVTSPRETWTYYTLTVKDQTDTAYRLNPLVPNPTVKVLPWQVSLLAADASWKYSDTGEDLGTIWKDTGVNDDDWPTGVALMWANRFNAAIATNNCDVLPGTMLAWTNSSGATNITYYFRTKFPMPSQAALAGLQSYQLRLKGIIDDGAVVYLNGQEAARYGMNPTNVITWSTFATRTGGSTYRFDTPFELPTTNVVFGADNLIAIEVHQVSLTSSDADFAAEVEVYVPAPQIRVDISRGGTKQITWLPLAGFRLYECDTVKGTYTPVLVSGQPATSPYVIPTPMGAKKFYQLMNP